MSTVDVSKAAAGSGGHLKKTLGWKDGVAMAMSVPAGLFSTFGFFLGVVSAWTAIAIWIIGLLIALLQNRIFSEMAAMFPRDSGGVSRYALEGWKRYFAPFGAIAAFGYWLGWSLSISITGLLFGELVVGTWFPDNTVSFTVFGNQLGLPHIFAGLAMVWAWAFNFFGLKLGVIANRILTILLLAGLMFVAAACFLSPAAHWDPSRLNWGFQGDWRTLVVVFYATAWAAYGTEICATFAPEYRNTARDTSKALRYSTIVVMMIFFLVPTSVAGAIGEQAIAANPVTYMVVALNEVLGGAGWIGTTVIAASMLLGIIATTADGGRALFGLAQEGMTIKQLDRLNRWGVPGRALSIDVFLNTAIMVLVGAPVSILLASNFGYILSIILALSAFLLLRKDRPQWPRPIRLRRHWIVTASLLVAFNTFVLAIGITNPSLLGYGGLRESLIAVGILLISVVFYAIRRIVQDRKPIAWQLPAPAMPGEADAAALAAEMKDLTPR